MDNNEFFEEYRKLKLNEILNDCRENANVVDMFVKADSIINNPKYKSILCSISGGADSDVMLDALTKLDYKHKITYIFFNTGLEYTATKSHLDYLEQRYGVTILRERAIKPIPLCCKEFGQPFLSKRVSDMMERLQNNDFKWEDEPFDVLYERYPNCRSALRWWCNDWNGKHVQEYGYSMFNINYNKGLKEFLIQNPPAFKISSQCCSWAKKKVSKQYIKKHKIDLLIIGVRKAEGGARSSAYKNCFDPKNSHHNYDNYRPIFWFTDSDKKWYDEHFGIVHSDCYTKWGFKRTGCVGCPYNRRIEDEISVVAEQEPNMYKAINNIFSESYEYTKQYREFQKQLKEKEKHPSRKALF